MSVDYYTCEKCLQPYADCSDYFCCGNCESRFCSNKCGGKQTDEVETEDGKYEHISTCVLCRMEEATDNQLLDFLLEHFDITYEKAMELYRADAE